MAARGAHDVLVVGAGNASGYLLRALSDIMGAAVAKDVLMIGQETYLPYERPALSKGYLIKFVLPCLQRS